MEGQIGGGDTKSRELCGPGMSDAKVNVSLTQGSALTPLLFIAVVELISRKISIKIIVRLVKTEVMWVGFRRKQL